jgi:CheY-like chemotaxis protein
MLGGDIRAESIYGQGSTFTLTIAAKPVPESAPTSDRSSQGNEIPDSQTSLESPVSLRGRILLAEDVVANQKLVKFLLQKSGLEIDVVDNGQQAVARGLEAEGAAVPYDLILMDLQMPEMDGYAATAALRAAGYQGRIVALTAHTSDEDRDQCLASGFDGFAKKPIQKSELLATCREQMNAAHSKTT